ncbi:MAG: hypothetical protein HY296_07655 [Thaumarchaeota archaeon]|nr:hypothetical protein [Nitrososphaerota archaeon]
MNQRSWIFRAALVVAGVIVALSIFFTVVGLPYSGASVAEICSAVSSCVETTTYQNNFVPTSLAVVPLLAGVLVALGLVEKRPILSWVGTTLLLGFSFVGLFSIGLLYMPFAIILVGLLAANPVTSKTST